MRPRDCGAGKKKTCLLPLLFCPWSFLLWPSPGILTCDTKLNNNVCFEAVHAGERERCHSTPHSEGSRKSVINHISRQVFRVVLNPAGEKPELVGAEGACRVHKGEGAG